MFNLFGTAYTITMIEMVYFLSGILVSIFVSLFFIYKFSVSRAKFNKLVFIKESIDSKYEELKLEQIKLQELNKEIMAEFHVEREKNIRSEMEKAELHKKNAQHGSDLEKMEKRFELQFENLANRIFDEKSNKFKKESQAGLENVLNPFREKIQEFNKLVQESFHNQAKEQFSLKNEIERIVLANEKITTQAENLTKALKGDSKIQGNWGEFILEKILEDSGLRKEIDYIVQAEDLNLKNIEGATIRPDVIVKLPEDKHIIIDSKVTLTDYEKYFSMEAEANALHLKQFLASIKRHINDLENKKYHDAQKIDSPDFVLMFIPIEGAYALAIQADVSLHNYAWNKKIVMVSPSTLFATLRTIASVWRLELQNQNALEIARRGGALYDKVVSFVEDFQKLGKQIENSHHLHGEVLKKLSEGRGNILRQVEGLKQLGVKVAKKLPVELLEVEE